MAGLKNVKAFEAPITYGQIVPGNVCIHFRRHQQGYTCPFTIGPALSILFWLNICYSDHGKIALHFSLPFSFFFFFLVSTKVEHLFMLSSCISFVDCQCPFLGSEKFV